MKPKIVLFDKSTDFFSDDTNDSFSGDLPALGILKIATTIEDIDGIEPVYLDGNICNNRIFDFILEHS